MSSLTKKLLAQAPINTLLTFAIPTVAEVTQAMNYCLEVFAKLRGSDKTAYCKFINNLSLGR